MGQIRRLFTVMFFGNILFLGNACNPNIRPLVQNSSPSQDRFNKQLTPQQKDGPFQKKPKEQQKHHVIAKVSKIIGTQAFILKNGSSKIPLQEGTEIELLEEIETGINTKIELSLVDGKVIINSWNTPISFSSERFIRLGEQGQGSFLVMQLPGDIVKIDNQQKPIESPVFFLKKGKVLFHNPSNIRLALRTPQIDVRFFGELFLAEAQNSGSWVGVISGAAKLTRQGQLPQMWLAWLIRGEQLFPDQIGLPNIHQILDTLQKTKNNYSIQQTLKTEPLITEFPSLPTFTLMEAEKWISRQENRWNQYVKDRNELRRNYQTPVIRSPKGNLIIRSEEKEKEVNPLGP